MSAILQVEDLSKVFVLHSVEGKRIVGCQQVGFTVRAGEFVGITGNSGGGKTTILKCLYRTYLPSSGKILFDSELFGKIDLVNSTERDIIAIRKHEISYVAQFLQVLPQMTALEVVVEALTERGLSYEHSHIQASSILRHFQLPGNLWDILPHTFSGGEKLRLNLARAMVWRPRLLLLDEPTASLDEQSKIPVRDMIKNLKEAGTAMVGVFHDLSFMKDVVDRHFQMHQGQLREAGIA
ncbi:MAG: Alpha-D-ribose 1-methylphosphonate 5-triphosphate synthase subunit PhnL [Firmicutes bacterium]|nr:Alpha-D-ribose 1-methylphosphonate 5-triphosphate synthase subunit PhnL [Bacillota bacterium]